ncbi:hypothetical protein KSS87_021022, partial [Heliosperma pusillum]
MKNKCVEWMMALCDLIWHYLSSMKYFGGSRNRSTISSLPDEVIINILSRLPAQTVLACRAVCSAWLHMTLTSQFTEMHLIRSTPLILGRALVGYYGRNLGWFFIDNFLFKKAEMRGLEFVRQGSKENRTLCVEAFCNGLLIFKNDFDKYVICNPITREEVAFWLRTDDQICGFYYHRLQKEYTLLIYQKSDKNKFSVYGLSSKDRRTLATCATFNLSCFCEAATCGALFWATHGSKIHNSLSVSTNSILMFNLETENFVVKDQPTDRYKRDVRTLVKLLEIDGKLGCFDVYQKSVQVWILEDVQTWKWCKRYVVDLNGFINIYGDRDKPNAETFVVANQN